MSMSSADQLIQAIKERIAAGADKASIKQETLAAGHKAEIFEAAYTLAEQELKSPALPSAWVLFVGGARFVRQHWKLPLLIGLPLVVIAAAGMIMEDHPANITVMVIGALLTFIALVVYFALLIAALKLVGQTTEQLDYKTAFTWVKRNFWAAATVYLLTSLVVWGGLILFIIPGIIVSIYLYFSIYALANEGVTGEQALLRSRSLVMGRWWTVFGKVFGIGFFSFMVVFVCMALAGLLTLFLPTSWGDIAFEVTNIIIQFIAAAITVVVLHAGNRLFLLFSESNPPHEITAGKWKYRFLMLVSVLAIGALVIFSILFAQHEEWQEMLMSEDGANELRAELFMTEFAATSYAFTHDDSFEGVCGVLQELITQADEVVCNDSAEAWAITATQDGEQWCADSTGYRKTLAVPLDDRDVCLPL